jgi:tellurite methyltransferase
MCYTYFNEQYSKEDSYWGSQPNLMVPLIGSYLKPQSRVLVVGCGEGRDAIFFARLGFEVIGTDIAEKGLNRAISIAEENNLNAKFVNLDAHEAHDCLGDFNAVIMMSVLQFLRPDKIPSIIEHFKSLVRMNGIFSAEVFSVDDPHYINEMKSEGADYSDLSLKHPQRKYPICFFEKGKLASYFEGWELIHYHEGVIWDKPHGAQTEFHEHGMAQLIAQKI